MIVHPIKNNTFYNKGSVLIFALAALTMISGIGIIFFCFAMLSSQISTNQVNQLEANLASSAGIYTAIAFLQQCYQEQKWYTEFHQGKNTFPAWYYAGEDVNCNGIRDQKIGNDSINEADVDEDGTLDCPLAMSQMPSCLAGNYSCKPYNRLQGCFYTKNLTNDDSITYLLRIEDLSGRIFIGNDYSVPQEQEWITGIPRMIETLIKWHEDLDTDYQEKPDIKIPLGLQKYFELKKNISDSLKQRIAKYFIEYGWSDPSVILPPVGNNVTPAVADPVELYKTWKEKKDAKIEIHSVIQYKTIETQKRSPVNINTASEPVLIACLNGLMGRYIRPGQLNTIKDKDGNAIYNLESDSLICIDINFDMAKKIAKEIIRRRISSAFVSWKDFAKFLGDLLEKNGNEWKDFTVDHACLIWANANPNSNLNKFHPDFPDSYLYSLWKKAANVTGKKYLDYRMDKSDLVVYTTEFCFEPTGYFLIESLGRAINDENSLSDYYSSLVIKIFDIYKHTTQSDFLNNNTFLNHMLSVYPKISNDQVIKEPINPKDCQYDGFISFLPIEYHSVPKESFFSCLQPKNGSSCEYSYIDGTAKNKTEIIQSSQHNDGVFLEPDALAFHTKSLEYSWKFDASGKPTGNEEEKLHSFISFWYKPCWNVNDPYARPHCLLEANSRSQNTNQNSEILTIFQFYSSSKGLKEQDEQDGQDEEDEEKNDSNNNQKSKKIRWNLFAWDVKEPDGMLPYDPYVEVPEDICLNRWMFIALQWGISDMKIRLNNHTTSIRIFYKQIAYIQFTTNMMCMKNGAILAEGIPLKIDSNLTEKSYLDWYDENELRCTNEKNNPRSMKQQLCRRLIEIELKKIASLTTPQAIAEKERLNQYLKEIDFEYNIERIAKEISLDFTLYSSYIKSQSDSDSNKKEIPPIIFSKQMRLGNGLKIYDEDTIKKYNDLVIQYNELYKKYITNPWGKPPIKPLPKEGLWIKALSSGMYANIVGGKDKEMKNIEDTISSLYYQGRYPIELNKDRYSQSHYVSKIDLSSFVPSGIKEIHIGALKWTEYLPQDAPDIQDSPATTICIELVNQDKNWMEVCVQPEGNKINKLSTLKLEYFLKFDIQQSRSPLLVAPMLDDLTIQYSYGVQWIYFSPK